jgi:hypothetical protein
MMCRTLSFGCAEHNYQVQTAAYSSLALHHIRYKEEHNLEEVPPPVLRLGRHTRKESNCSPNYITSVDHQSIFASDLKLRGWTKVYYCTQIKGWHDAFNSQKLRNVHSAFNIKIFKKIMSIVINWLHQDGLMEHNRVVHEVLFHRVKVCETFQLQIVDSHMLQIFDPIVWSPPDLS